MADVLLVPRVDVLRVAGMKLAELVAIVAVQAAYGVNFGFGASLLVLATAILATMLPLSPGNLGTYEGSMFLVYRYLGVAPELAVALRTSPVLTPLS